MFTNKKGQSIEFFNRTNKLTSELAIVIGLLKLAAICIGLLLVTLQTWQTAGIRSPVVDHVSINKLRHLQVIDIIVA